MRNSAAIFFDTYISGTHVSLSDEYERFKTSAKTAAAECHDLKDQCNNDLDVCKKKLDDTTTSL